MKKKIYYQVGNHEAYRVSGAANINCLRSIGSEIVEDVEDADIVILHDEPWVFPRYFMMNPEIQEKYIVAYSVWETTALPEIYRHNLELVDEIWTASSYCNQIFKSHYSNVYTISHPTDIPVINEDELQKLKDVIGYDEDEFYFYTITKISPNRKNIPALLRALPKVLHNRNARYLIKTDAPLPQGWSPNTDQLTFLPFHMSDEMIHALHHLGNCYVSAHCSEGWGLCMSEAMAHGNLVVATGYSGNMDFMTEENSLPVKYRLNPASINTPWPAGEGQWASIDEADLAARLVMSLENWNDLASKRDRAKKDMEHFGSAAVAERMFERLRSL